MSLIYYANRGGLEDRVFRLRTGKSAASTPMPRTLHQINNVRIEERDDGQLVVRAAWATLYTRQAVSNQFFGHVTYHLKANGDSWTITRKHIVLLNDTIDSVLDFYHL
ncbi:Anthranilate 1,2-dioxygenase small subunit [compost metagenome]